MADDDVGASQSPPTVIEKSAGAEPPPAKKPFVPTTTFIDKGSRKVVPKNVRRRARPGAPPPKAPPADAPPSETSSAQLSTSQAVPDSEIPEATHNAPSRSSQSRPTHPTSETIKDGTEKKASQEVVSGGIQNQPSEQNTTTQAAGDDIEAERSPKRPRIGPSTPQSTQPQHGTATSTQQQPNEQTRATTVSPSAAPAHAAVEDVDAGRSPTRQRLEFPAEQTPPSTTVSTQLPPGGQVERAVIFASAAPTDSSTAASETYTSTGQYTNSSATSTIASPASGLELVTDKAAETLTAGTTPSTKAKGKRKASSLSAIENAEDTPTGTSKPRPKKLTKAKGKGKAAPVATAESTEDPDTGPTEAPAKVTTKGRGKRKAVLTATEDAEETQAGTSDAHPKVTAKRRGKRKAVALEDQTELGVNEDGTPPIVKKPRKQTVRKKKNAPTIEAEEAGQEGTPAGGQPKKKRQTKKKPPGTVDGENTENGDNSTVDDEGKPKRKRGREREPTPSDAEEQEIDSSVAMMADLAASSFRIGKLSEREKAMRLINWEEVKEKRRERELELAANGGKSREEVDAMLNDAEEARNGLGGSGSGPRMREINGEIVIDDGTVNVDVYAAADRDAQLLEQVEEGDLTTRVTTQSWVLANKRDPADRVMTGRSKRWTTDETNAFYDALAMFGIDFQIISDLFPGTRRHNIKTKFTREEKENPERIKAALAGQRSKDWEQYLRLSNKAEDEFIDPEKLKRELEAEAREAQVEIDRVAAEYAEERRQRRLAGIEDSEDERGSGNENARKKKKKERGRKAKPQGFPEEEGVEILGDDVQEDEPAAEEYYEDDGYGDDYY